MRVRPIRLIHAHPDDEVFAGGAAVTWLSSLRAEIIMCVAAVHQLLRSRGIESAGSGRLVGTTDELDTCVAPDFAGHARRRAYEVYAGGDKNIEAVEGPQFLKVL